MGEIYIRPFSFCDYFQRDWDRFHLWQETQRRDEEEPQEGEGEYKFSGTQSKTPILFDEDDYKFLSQFPPAVWSDALKWRYNFALMLAHDQRMKGGDDAKKISHDDQITDFVNGLSLSDTYHTYTFGKIWTGMSKLVKKLEAPVLAHGEHRTVPGYEEGDKGIVDIDIDDPAQRDAYAKKYGLHDYDLTGLQRAEAYIDSLKPDQLGIKGELTDDKIRRKRAELKKNALHSFRGMRVMQKDTATAALRDWIKLMGLKAPDGTPILGRADQIKDPHTGQPPSMIRQDQLPSQIRPPKGKGDGVWSTYDSVGADDEQDIEHPSGGTYRTGRREIRIPAIQRRLTYTVRSNKGDAEPEERTEDVWMPFLLPGTLLPRITLTAAQKAALKKRRETPQEGRRGTKTSVEGASDQLNSLEALIQNWDILTDDQRQTIFDNRRTLWHRLKHKYDRDWRREKQDPYSSPTGHYIGAGFAPNYGQKPTDPINIDPEEYIRIVGAHHDELWDEASKGVVYWMRDNLGYTGKADVGTATAAIGKRERAAAAGGQTDRSGVLSMMSAAVEDIIHVAYALLASNLQNPLMGISDPENGLTGRLPNVSDKLASKRRIWFARNFASEVAQKAIDPALHLSRRARAKGVRGGTQSTNAVVGSGEKASELGAQLGDQGQAGVDARRGAAGVHDPRRVQLTPGSISSSQWLTEGVGFLKSYFETKRAEIAKMLGEKAAAEATDGATDKLSASLVANTLYAEALETVGMAGGGAAVKGKAKGMIREKIRSDPAYANLQDGDIAEIEKLIDQISDNEVADSPEAVDARLDRGATEDANWKSDLIGELLSSSSEGEYHEGDPDSEDYDESDTPSRRVVIGKPVGKYGIDLADKRLPESMIPKFIVGFIFNEPSSMPGLGMGASGVNRFAVPLIRKAMQVRGQNPSEEEVATMVASMTEFAAKFSPVQLQKQPAVNSPVRAAAKDVGAEVAPGTAQAAAPAAAAPGSGGDFAERLKDIGQWPALAADPGLAANVDAAERAYTMLRTKIRQQAMTGNYQPSEQESQALLRMSGALRGLGRRV